MMRFRFVLICMAFSMAAPTVPASQKEKTHPVQATALLAAIRKADKIVVHDGSLLVYEGGKVAPQRIIYSSDNPQDISELRESITIEPPNGWFRCACIPPI
jgi:hypothetical protein